MSQQEQMNRFAIAPQDVSVGRSIFNRNHSIKFSFNAGQLIPFYMDEVMPGDTFSINTSKVVRVQPLVTPVYDNLFLDCFYFFVPYRLLWTHWKNFMGESEKAWVPTATYSTPKIAIPSGGYNCGTIADYLGVPIGVGANSQINALPFRAYATIANEWFRDTSTQDPLQIPMTDTTVTGVNTGTEITDVAKGGIPFTVCKYPDYFTSCLPSPQRSASPVSIAFDTSAIAPVKSWDPQTFSITSPHSDYSGVEVAYANGSSFVAPTGNYTVSTNNEQLRLKGSVNGTSGAGSDLAFTNLGDTNIAVSTPG